MGFDEPTEGYAVLHCGEHEASQRESVRIVTRVTAEGVQSTVDRIVELVATRLVTHASIYSEAGAEMRRWYECNGIHAGETVTISP